MIDKSSASAFVKKELDASVHFWLTHGLDSVNGGIYTCLDRTGKIYSTDKSVWMQGRCGWTFSYLCNTYGPRGEWLDAARSCIDFMERCCINRAAGSRMYFTVTGDGKPLRQRRYCFSEGFYAMANAEYYAATGDRTCLENARRAYDLIWDLHHGMPDPTGLGPKTIPETRTGRAQADPMIYLNLTQVMLRCDPEQAAKYNERARVSADAIIRFHYKPDLKCSLENVGPNGETRLDITEGRIVNPGHDIECSWFLMEQAKRTGDRELMDKALQIFRNAAESGWDKEYGGLLYFIDCLGCPPESYEHDMKLWWPHNELLIASLMAYLETGDDYYADWFNRGLDYVKQVFVDPEYGEWYGYLRRDGKPTEPPCKGSTFKGPFNVPRCLIMLDKMLEKLA